MRSFLALVVLAGLMGSVMAQAPQPLTTAQRAQMQQAQAMIAAGRGARDAQKLLQGARMMSRAEAPGVVTILDEAKGLATGNSDLILEIEALRRAQPAQTSCNWQRLCTASGCSWTQACQ